MNYSLLNAGRTTHLKIVAVALVAGIAVVVAGINAKTTDFATGHVETTFVKAGQPATFAGHGTFTVR
jgi:hypothetical protein